VKKSKVPGHATEVKTGPHGKEKNPENGVSGKCKGKKEVRYLLEKNDSSQKSQELVGKKRTTVQKPESVSEVSLPKRKKRKKKKSVPRLAGKHPNINYKKKG